MLTWSIKRLSFSLLLLQQIANKFTQKFNAFQVNAAKYCVETSDFSQLFYYKYKEESQQNCNLINSEKKFSNKLFKMHELAIDDGQHAGKINVIDSDHSPVSTNLDEIIRKKLNEKKLFYALEVSPVPSSEHLNFKKFIPEPAFTSVTWLFDNNLKAANVADAPAIQLAKLVKKSNPVLLHLTCYKLTESKLNDIIANGVDNILALRGDLQDSDQPWKHAIDLVRAIKKINPNIFVTVAGYPEVHSEATDREIDLKFLKEKVDAGANSIVTNVCFSFSALADFIKSCREIGITVPIVPGIFVPSSYTALVQMCKICKVKVPDDQLAVYRSLKNQEVEFREFAVSNAVKFINQLFNNEYERIYGIHFFTLNKYENVYEAIKRLNFE